MGLKDFADVYAEYADQVFRFILSITRNETLAEELTQETFYKAYLHIGKFKGESSLYAWLCQIAKNLVYNDYKKNRRLVQVDPSIEDRVRKDNHISEDFILSLLKKEQATLLHRILHTLPEPYKEVFTLRIFGELKFREIAELFGKTESWAKITYYRAKERIVSEMEARK
ncbi:RNA polymerase sigma factor [Paenibacillus luteus]|uniref:RNA polymerase sigma factor n=1 Tax=Paenibacillus luteus TaxID=2545753 RepID=UPI0019D691FB|nr:RNA polymerase sigma factor [Paenibacillus luteus]